jgi:hypothetical protein
MAIISSIIDSISGQSGLSIINDETGQSVWQTAKCVSLEIGSESANTDQPAAPIALSDPNTFNYLSADNIKALKIIKPSRVRIIFICPDLSSIEHILDNFNDTRFTCSITTKAVIISSMCPTEITVDQNPQMLSATRLTMSLEQASLPQALTYFPFQNADISTYGEQIQTPQTLTQTVSGLYTKISNTISRLI